MEKRNLKTIIVSLLVVIVGIILILLDLFLIHSASNLWISIGCSLIASGLVIFLTEILVEIKKTDPLDEWGLEKIYHARSERNLEADPYIDKARYCIDGIAFGLSSFRTKYAGKIETCLKKGVNIRIITMNPDGNYIRQREDEEKTAIRDSIIELVELANRLNAKNFKGKIIIKAYDCMTLDYYWRVDDDLYIGPYWFGYKSSDTITYKFTFGGKGFTHYSDYFESLWNNTSIIHPLTDVTELVPKKNKKKR